MYYQSVTNIFIFFKQTLDTVSRSCILKLHDDL